MHTIYINGRFLTQKLTGQQRYSRELVTALDRRLQRYGHCGDSRLVLLAPAGSDATLNLSSIELRRVGRLRGHAWDQIDLAAHAARGVLLSLCGTGPLAHLRHIVTIHDAAPFANPQNFTPTFRRAYGALVPMLVKAARRVITVSEFSKAEISRYCHIDPGKIAIVGNGADHILRAPADRSVLEASGLAGRRYVLAVGSLSVNKNFGLVVEARPTGAPGSLPCTDHRQWSEIGAVELLQDDGAAARLVLEAPGVDDRRGGLRGQRGQDVFG